MLVTLNASCRGSEHIKVNKPVQDFSYAGIDKNVGYAFVADGHGGEKYIRSEYGASYACYCAAEIIVNIRKDFLAEIKRLSNDSVKRKRLVEENLRLMCSKLSLLWRAKVCSHFEENPLTETELALCKQAKVVVPIEPDSIPILYGTTLLVAVYFAQYDFWFSLQIGDGKCALIKADNSLVYPVPEDESQGFGVTKSLCRKNAAEDFRYAFGFEKIAGITVMTDGMTDSFDSEKLPDFLLSIKKNALADVDRTKAELNAFLPTLSAQGSGDDISIAGIFVKEEESCVKSLLNSVTQKK